MGVRLADTEKGLENFDKLDPQNKFLHYMKPKFITTFYFQNAYNKVLYLVVYHPTIIIVVTSLSIQILLHTYSPNLGQYIEIITITNTCQQTHQPTVT